AGFGGIARESIIIVLAPFFASAVALHVGAAYRDASEYFRTSGCFLDLKDLIGKTKLEATNKYATVMAEKLLARPPAEATTALQELVRKQRLEEVNSLRFEYAAEVEHQHGDWV